MDGWRIVDVQHDNPWRIKDTAKDMDEYHAKQAHSSIIEDTNRIISRIYSKIRRANEL